MDPFEDFQMKPITEGLGFYKKSEEREKDVAPQADAELEDLMAELNKVSSRLNGHPLDKDNSSVEASKKNLDNEIEIVPALTKRPEPRKAAVETDLFDPLPSRPEMPPIIEDRPAPMPHSRPRTVQKPVATAGTRRGAADSPVRDLKPAVFSISSALLDVMMVMAIALIFLITLLMVTGVNLNTVIGGLQNDLMTQLSMVLLYTAILQLYVIVTRSFFGKTLGEWTFDFQMGDNEQIKSSVYPILVLWRSMIIMGTGVITLPILSILFRKDLASYLTGLQFYKKQS